MMYCLVILSFINKKFVFGTFFASIDILYQSIIFLFGSQKIAKDIDRAQKKSI